MSTQVEIDLLEECIALEVRLLLAKYQRASGQDDCTILGLVVKHATQQTPRGC